MRKEIGVRRWGGACGGRWGLYLCSPIFYLRRSISALRSSIFYLRRRADQGVGVGPARDPVEPAVEVVAQRARPQNAEAVLLPQGIDLDYYI